MMQAPVQEGGSGWSTQGTPDAEQDVLVKGAVKLEKALKVLQAQAHQRPGMKRCIGSQEITIFFIGPSYGELNCGSFGVLQSKF